MPRHWSQKRAYLQGKRGIEKPPFQLPAYIEATGAFLPLGSFRDIHYAMMQCEILHIICMYITFFFGACLENSNIHMHILYENSIDIK